MAFSGSRTAIRAWRGMENALIANNTIANTTDAAIHIDPDSGHSSNRVGNNIFLSAAVWTLGSGSSMGTPFGNDYWFGRIPGPFASAGDVFADPLLVQVGSFS